MQNFIKALKISLQNKNWYSALFIALSLPDICGGLENPTLGSEKRYVLWFNKYLNSYYTRGIGPHGQHVVTFLSGEDCYALRCSFLHEGRDEITDQRCQKVLNNFRFTTDLSHMNYIDNGTNKTLQLQVKQFCEEISTGTEEWLKDVKSNQDIQKEITKMLKIHDSIFTKDDTGYHIP